MQKYLLFFLGFIYSFLSLGQQCERCATNLIWSDEFDGTSLDLTKWSYELGDGCNISPDMCGWGNNELQYYTNRAENVRLDGGILIIEARNENYTGRQFTSGRILTKNKFQHTYGCFEARIRMPRGRGLWPAFWMLRHDNTWPMTGEIDIMEYRGDITNETHGTLHYGCAWPGNQWNGSTFAHSTNLYDDFHIYKVEWTPEAIKWYFDETLFKTVTRNPNSLNPPSCDDPWPWEEDYFIILNLAVGGWFTGATLPSEISLTKSTLEIDYVRVYDYTPMVDMARGPYGGNLQNLPARIEAEHYDEACAPGISYYDLTATNEGGIFRNDYVGIEATTDVGGGYNVGWLQTGEWLEYTVNVPSGGLFDIGFRIASDAGGGQVRLEVDGTDVTGTVNLPRTWGWQNWTTHTINSINIPAGRHTIRLQVINGGFNFNYMDFTGISLPVEFLALEAFLKDKEVTISWQTASEINSNFFIVERSADANAWQEISKVKSTGREFNFYQITDKNPSPGANFYRIKHVDIDGRYLFSNTVEVSDPPSKPFFKVYPNPSDDQFFIEGKSINKNFSFQISQASGLLIEEKTNYSYHSPISFGKNLPAGFYLLKIILDDKVFYQKLVKN